MSKSPYDILIRPLITESALRGQEQNKYFFQVHVAANKREIKGAIEQAFGVKVAAVNIVKTQGKLVRKNRGGIGRKDTVKKAIITLVEGQALTL